MSQYFSRLAERSGVTTTSLAAQSNSARTNGLSNWNEQTTEVTTSVSSPAQDNSVVQQSPPDHSTPDISENRQSSVLSSTASTAAQGTQPRVSAIIPGRTVSRGFASELHVDLEANPYSSDNVSRSTSQTESTTPAAELAESITNASNKDNNEGRTMDVKAKAQTSIDRTSRVLIDKPSADSTINDSAVSYSASVSEYVDDYLIDVHDAKSSTDSTEKLERSRAMSAPQPSDKNELIEQISSSPARAPWATATPAHSSSNSSVQVNIGKIELEIHAPAAAANRAPQPVRTILAPSPAASRNSVFNPHRHYLRRR